MAILIDEKKRVVVQGVTGREGRARTRLMRDYGTNVVAGVTPGKGGQTVLGVPVFNTPQEAVDSLGEIDISVLFVPAAGVKDAAISAIDAGIKLTVLVPDRVPVWDAMEIGAAAKAKGAMFLGPNTLGALSPGKGVIGMIGGRAESARQWFKPGIPKGVGVISRSGGMASSTGYYLGQAVVEILKKIKGESLMSETDKNAVWNTAITRVQPNKVAVRGYDIAELMGRVSVGAAVYLVLQGELPPPAVARLMDAILVSSIDHGATPPSALP